MRSKVLHALADMAAKNGAGAAEILRDYAIYEQKIASSEGAKAEAENWKREAARREERRGECEQKRILARDALGDGWHPLKSGGAVLIKRIPIRLRDGGEHTEERRKATLDEATALGWEWLSYSVHEGSSPWTAEGEAAIDYDLECPF